jgi:AcrR family transcriptional regulator
MKVAKINKDMILQAALKLILEQGGSAALTIRDVAKELGCSHPNIYNYYSSMLELRWDCLLWALETMMEHARQHLSPDGDSDTRFKQFFLVLSSYFLEHPAYYRLIWFDPMGDSVPDYALPRLQEPSLRLRDFALELYPELGNPQTAAETMLLIHRYFHGEMSAIISGRVLPEDFMTITKRVAHNCLWMMRACITDIHEER